MTDITISDAADLVDLQGPMLDRSSAAVKKGRVLISMDASGSLLMQNDPNPHTGWTDKFVAEHNNETFLAISDTSIIEIVLTGLTTWQFDVDMGLLEFKKASNKRWYGISYSQGQPKIKNILLNASPSGLPQNTEDARHSFNLMLKIGQTSPSGKPGRSLSVIIDPDAKNPPPIGSMVDPQSLPVPLLSLTA